MFQEHAVCAQAGKQAGSSCEVCCSSESFHGQNNPGLCPSLPHCIKYTSRRKHPIPPHLVRKSFPSSGTPECSSACSDRKPMNHPHLQNFKNNKPRSFPRRTDSSPPFSPAFTRTLRIIHLEEMVLLHGNSTARPLQASWGTRTERLLTEAA